MRSFTLALLLDLLAVTVCWNSSYGNVSSKALNLSAKAENPSSKALNLSSNPIETSNLTSSTDHDLVA